MRAGFLPFLLTCLTCSSSASLAAQAELDLPLGFEAELLFEERQNPYAFHGYALGLEAGEIFIALGRQVLRLREDSETELVHEFQAGGGAGLLMRPRGRKEIYFSDFKTDDLHRIDLRSGRRSKLHLPAFTFDIAVSQQGDVFASAFPYFLRSFGRAGIYRVRGEGSEPELFFEVDGPSGPITFDGHGALYYAEQSDIFPSPPGSIRLLRFPQFARPNFGIGKPNNDLRGVLPKFSGSEALRDLDGAYDIAFDDRGRLYITDPFDGGIKRSLPGSMVFDPIPLLPSRAESSLQMQFIAGEQGDFAAYQPAFGSQLLLSTTGNATTRVWSIRPARPRLELIKQPASGPGNICIEISGLPHSQMALLWASAAPTKPERALFELEGLPFWFGLDYQSSIRSWQGKSDSEGRMLFEIPYFGGLDLTLQVQGAGLIFLPPFEGFLASSNSIAIRLNL